VTVDWWWLILAAYVSFVLGLWTMMVIRDGWRGREDVTSLGVLLFLGPWLVVGMLIDA
jgi:hypothetical protein